MAERIGNATIQAVARIEPAATVAALGQASDESMRRLASLETGKTFQAQVLSRLTNGDFVVGIADAVARMALPEPSRVGDRLSLTLLTQAPRPLFRLDAPVDPAFDPEAPVLSPAARLIDTLLHSTTSAKTTLHGMTPLVSLASAETLAAAPLAVALKDSLAHSGLFYESHVNEWANGTRTLAQLQAEPQMRAAVSPPGAAPTLQVYQADNLGAPVSALAINADQMIKMQLDTLEQRHVAWQGELFPGQQMAWEVREDTSTGQLHEEGAPRSWQSVLRIELPHLGRVEATLDLREGRLQLRMRAESTETVDALTADGAGLSSALEAAGMPVELLTVRHDA